MYEYREPLIANENIEKLSYEFVDGILDQYRIVTIYD